MDPQLPVDDTAPSSSGLSSSGLLEDLVAGALEALDRGGEAGLEAFLAGHPAERAQVLALITQFRHTGLLARDSGTDIPERLGEFRLQRRLGGGGMGVVFVAEQESLRRSVALKVIRPDLLFFDGARERFRREIEVIARLSHPAIVPIVATGEHNGMPWYAMALIDGCSVDEAVRRLHDRRPEDLNGEDLRGALAGSGVPARGGTSQDALVFAGGYWEACVRLIRQAAVGLAHAHERGIVHRDVKPSNVMLTPDGRALVLDFGLALVQGDPRLTRSGAEPGSPAYMAPEQVRGAGTDQRSDVYSLAATLFQLLDLAPPFAAPDQEQLRQKILNGQVAPLRNRSIPRELRLVLAAAMDLDRERRYATAEEFAADLTAVLARRPIVARRLPWRIRALRWSQRHRTAASLLASLLVIALALPAAIAWQRGEALRELTAAKDRSDQSLKQSLAAVRALLVRFGAGDLQSLAGGQKAAEGMFEQAIAILDELPAEAGRDAVLQNRTYAERWLIASLLRQGKAEAALARAQAVFVQWPDPDHAPPAIAMLLASIRHDLVAAAANGLPVPGLEAMVVRMFADLQLAAKEPLLATEVVVMRVDMLLDQAELLRQRGDAAGAEQRLREAVQAIDVEVASSPQAIATYATAHNRYASSLWRAGQLDEATREFELVLAKLSPPLDRTKGRPEHVRLRAYALWGLSHVAVTREDVPAAADYLAKAAELYEINAFAYPDDGDSSAYLACVLTELAQARALLHAGADEVIAMLERARVLFGSARDVLAMDRERWKAYLTSLRLLCMQYKGRNDHRGQARTAREVAEVAKEPEALAMAAWHLLLAAGDAESAGDDAAAKANEAAALAALFACEQAGWHPPVDLSLGPPLRLVGLPEFAALQARHPPENVLRRPGAAKGK
ncbi:MAG: serine/threonine protein kinase [Planctomycetes bacterium]|nr:serine/threonine protein kinase [Planctomycetota bacterium]